ncbi:MAG TPA: hypothetical protein VLM80_11685 [Anaerolineales bacterium]|nr:hypothetical protein [Anaerolineales bacterium]
MPAETHSSGVGVKVCVGVKVGIGEGVGVKVVVGEGVRVFVVLGDGVTVGCGIITLQAARQNCKSIPNTTVFK